MTIPARAVMWFWPTLWKGFLICGRTTNCLLLIKLQNAIMGSMTPMSHLHRWIT